MAVTRLLYQTAHIVIVVFYTLFCFAALGVESPIPRFVLSFVTVLPVLWAVWVLARATIPAETLEERLREELGHETASATYRRLSAELLGMTSEVREMDRVVARIRAGELSREDGFRQLNELERRMQRRVESMRASVRL